MATTAASTTTRSRWWRWRPRTRAVVHIIGHDAKIILQGVVKEAALRHSDRVTARAVEVVCSRMTDDVIVGSRKIGPWASRYPNFLSDLVVAIRVEAERICRWRVWENVTRPHHPSEPTAGEHTVDVVGPSAISHFGRSKRDHLHSLQGVVHSRRVYMSVYSYVAHLKRDEQRDNDREEERERQRERERESKGKGKRKKKREQERERESRIHTFLSILLIGLLARSTAASIATAPPSECPVMR